MALVKRLVKGSPVSAAEYDAVVDVVETVEIQINESLAKKDFNTYALMLAQSTPVKDTICRVLVDEDKSLNNTIYIWYASGERLWLASLQDN